MNDSIVRFDKVTKSFQIGYKLLLKEVLIDIVKSKKRDVFYAIQDVSFDVKKGETLGIIGGNGSGKSTILKLIAGVIVPTSGKVEVKGRIAPLIELGAGFHPELSGKENIYINGTILGLSRKEIKSRLNSIVSFAELSEFIDTPIKHYSSGMYLRLGFSIAIHTDPQVLLVDEILAVGDESFQAKCFNKLEEIKKKNTTIVFVSHDLKSISKFCDRVILIEHGKIKMTGEPNSVLNAYLKAENE